MDEHSEATPSRSDHWEAAYEANAPDAVSWYQAEPSMSLALIDALALGANDPVLDLGGGSSLLVDRLLAGGHTDVTVLDIADGALRSSRERLGGEDRVTWIVQDLLTWEPDRTYQLWHDRAVFHFLMGAEVEKYKEVLRSALDVGGYVVMATFAPDGPERCSGLPVTRYDADGLMKMLGGSFELVDRRTEEHQTPSGAIQSFVWISARRSAV